MLFLYNDTKCQQVFKFPIHRCSLIGTILENVKPKNSYILFLTIPALPFFSSFVRKIVDPI